MRKAALSIFVLIIVNTIHAQVIKNFTIQISNPEPCTTCCNGSIQIQVSNCGGPISCSLTIPTSTLPHGGSCLWINLCNGIYTVSVDVGDTIFCPAICNVTSGYFNLPTGITDKNITQFDTIELFPNPATEALTIKLQNQDIPSYIFARLINSTGEIVKEENLFFIKGTAQLKMGTLPQGIYILELITKGQRNFRRSVLIQ
jgi:hypothetical protein